MDTVKGFEWGWTGSSGGTLPGFQRNARRLGQPEPTRIMGSRGQGRADRARDYTITVTRLSDGKTLSEVVGPAYWSKKKWQKERTAAQHRLIAKLK